MKPDALGSVPALPLSRGLGNSLLHSVPRMNDLENGSYNTTALRRLLGSLND